jgi:putative ABC transport system permease protein
VPGAMGGAPLLSFLLLELRPGAEAGTVRRLIESGVAGVDVYTPAELSVHDVDLGRQFFAAVLNLLVGVAWLAAMLAVGLAMDAAVIDRRREFAVMKALGVGAAGLAVTVVIEAILVCLLAFPVALLIARASAAAIEAFNPLYRVLPWRLSVITRGAVASLGAALIGALLPIRQLRSLEPDMVLRT